METVAEFLAGKGAAVHTVRPDATVYEALELMAEKNIGAVIVTDETGKLHGIFSERDYARKMMIKGRDPHTTKVGEIMTTTVVSVNTDTRLRDCMSIMTEKRIRHLPGLEGRQADRRGFHRRRGEVAALGAGLRHLAAGVQDRPAGKLHLAEPVAMEGEGERGQGCPRASP